jgi:RNA polymerase sigma-70 factor, ECF subfamily
MDVWAAREARVSDAYEEFRPLMFSIAYRMLGSASEAEDIVQEAFLRFHRESTAGTVIDSPKAYLSTVTTRLAIDQLRSARVRRERYVGTWLPEPLVTDTESDVARHAEAADSLSMAFLLLLESLSPVERAVFLLREVFDYGYDEIADVVGKSEDNCRQIAVRARRRIESHKPRFEASRERREELARRFFAAVTEGDTDGLLALLAADVVAYGDGGGKAPAFPKPVYGRDHVARLLFRAAERGLRRGVIGARYVEINGQPGAIFIDPEGRPLAVVTVDIADGLVQTVRAVSNPEKLSHLTA